MSAIYFVILFDIHFGGKTEQERKYLPSSLEAYFQITAVD